MAAHPTRKPAKKSGHKNNANKKKPAFGGKKAPPFKKKGKSKGGK